MEAIECVSGRCRPLVFIIRTEFNPPHTIFPTPSELNLQVGFVVYPTGGTIPPHLHLPLERRIVGTAEVLVVKKGRCLLDICDDDKRLVATRELRTGDVMLMVGGGHGFRMLEDTVLLEVKQGPYTGLQEKERF
jgi:hypothetical protein